MTDPAQAFPRLILSTIFEISDPEAGDCITDGGNDRSVAAVFISENERTIFLFQFKHYQKYEKANKYFSGDSADKLVTFFTDLRNPSQKIVPTFNPLLLERVRAIRECIENDTFDFKVVLCSNGSPLLDAELKRFQDHLNPYQHIEIVQIHTVELARLFSSNVPDRDVRQLKYVEDQILERSDGNVRGIQCTVKAEELVKFLGLNGSPTQIDDGLFRENVRLYLGQKNAINGNIRRTLLGRHRYQFWYLNNGITIVCEKYEYQPRLSTPIRVTCAQIVNGCQTANEIYDSFRLSAECLLGVTVSVKIIETAEETLVGNIAEATNSQTAIRGRDLRANDDVQHKLEVSLAALGFSYERKRNQHIDKAADKRVDALRAGQAVLAYYLGKPDKAKTASEQIFESLYDEVFNPKRFIASDFLVATQLLNMIEVRKELAKKSLNSVSGKFFQEDWLIEGTFHVLYLVGLLATKRAMDLSNLADVSTLIDEGISEVGEFVKSQPNVAAYRLFRSTKSKDLIFNLVNEELPAQLKLAV